MSSDSLINVIPKKWVNCTDRNGNPLPPSKRHKCNQYRALYGYDPLPEMTITKPAPIGSRKSAPVERKNVELKVEPWMTCEFRGEQVGQIGCGSCSIDRRIYQCEQPENAGKQCVRRCPTFASKEFREQVEKLDLLVCERCELCKKNEE